MTRAGAMILPLHTGATDDMDIVSFPHRTLSLGLYSEVYDAETTGILLALEMVPAYCPKLVICTDIMAAITTIVNNNPRNLQTPRRSLQLIYQLQERGIEVPFLWTKPHVGFPGNELADTLAKAATYLNPIEPQTGTVTWLRTLPRRQMIADWERSLPEDHVDHLPIFPSMRMKPLGQLGIKRNLQLYSIRAGVSRLDRRPWEQNSCQCGGQFPSSHFLFQCTTWTRERREIFRTDQRPVSYPDLFDNDYAGKFLKLFNII